MASVVKRRPPRIGEAAVPDDELAPVLKWYEVLGLIVLAAGWVWSAAYGCWLLVNL